MYWFPGRGRPGWVEFRARHRASALNHDIYRATLLTGVDLLGRASTRVNETIKPLSDLEQWGVSALVLSR
jgi:hypothetical protein